MGHQGNSETGKESASTAIVPLGPHHSAAIVARRHRDLVAKHSRLGRLKSAISLFVAG